MMQIRTVTGHTIHSKEPILVVLALGIASGCTGGAGIDATLESELRATDGSSGLRSTRLEDAAAAGMGAPMPAEAEPEHAEPEEQPQGGADDDPPSAGDPHSGDDEQDNQDGDDAAEPATPPVQPPPFADDSPRCGNGYLDDDELCDVAVPEGEFGACRTECPPTPECPFRMLIPRTCWSQCSC